MDKWEKGEMGCPGPMRGDNTSKLAHLGLLRKGQLKQT